MGPEESHDELRDCQEYLRETRVEERWDCESVLSTYSTLDNHPSVIGEPRLKPVHSSRRRRPDGGITGAEAPARSLAQVLADKRSTGDIFGGLKVQTLGAALRPRTKTAAPRAAPGATSALARDMARLAMAGKRSGARVGAAESVDDDDDDDDEDNGAAGMGEAEDWEERPKKLRVRQGETTEEKKARKQAIKLERREKRASKKQTKMAVKDANLSAMGSAAHTRQDTDRASVYKY